MGCRSPTWCLNNYNKHTFGNRVFVDIIYKGEVILDLTDFNMVSIRTRILKFEHIAKHKGESSVKGRKPV